MKTVSVRVPATTANLGPGFDTLGVALNLYNTVTLGEKAVSWPDAFMAEAASAFFEKTGLENIATTVSIHGEVPRSRGLGSSVTVRLGLIAGLNAQHDSPLTKNEVLQLVIGLEGHPDNAVPACHGGFAVSASHGFGTTAVDPALKFVAVIPDYEVETHVARQALPAQVSLTEAVQNIQNSGLIVAAFTLKKYEWLRGSFTDHLHQPYRAKLIPGCHEAFRAAEAAGALAAFISGSGSTPIALTLNNEKEIARVMSAALQQSRTCQVVSRILQADNEGVKIS